LLRREGEGQQVKARREEVEMKTEWGEKDIDRMKREPPFLYLFVIHRKTR